MSRTKTILIVEERIVVRHTRLVSGSKSAKIICSIGFFLGTLSITTVEHRKDQNKSRN